MAIRYKCLKAAKHLVNRDDFPFRLFRNDGLPHPGGREKEIAGRESPKGRMGSRLYAGIIYYKWRYSQGRHYQTLSPSRIPTAYRNLPLHPPRSSSIHFARGLSIRTAELLCRLIDSLSEVRYSTWYGFNFMPIISVQRQANRTEQRRGGWIFAILHAASFPFQGSFDRDVKKNHN